MRMILLAASAMMLASCTTPTMNALNANTGQQQATGATADEPPVPIQFRRPPKQFVHWGGYAYGGMY